MPGLNRYLKAFTIMEMIIAMILMLLLFLFITFAYLKTTQIFNSYSRQVDKGKHITIFIEKMNYLFNTSSSVSCQANILTFKSSNFREDKLIINESHVYFKDLLINDTMPFQVSRMQPVYNQHLKDSFILDAFELEIKDSFQTYHCKFFKQQSPDIIINNYQIK